MKVYVILFLFFIFSGCEELIYGKYEIYEHKNRISSISESLYTVRKGDNLHTISKRNFVSINDLIKINKIASPFKIYPKQKLLLPKKNYHLVKKGETLYSISRKYGVDRYQLFKLNNLKSERLIFVGQRLLIPLVKKMNAKKNNKKIIKKKYKEKIITEKSNNSFIWPVKGKIILNFGMIKPGLHNDGINISADIGKPVYASEKGEVIYTGNEIPGYGNLILIKHKNNWITAYAHLKEINLTRGMNVKRGQQIGKVGNSGNVSSSQLHFEIRKGRKALDPVSFLL